MSFWPVYWGGSWPPHQEMEEEECFKKKRDLSLKYFEEGILGALPGLSGQCGHTEALARLWGWGAAH